jgi:hypothetical protein
MLGTDSKGPNLKTGFIQTLPAFPLKLQYSDTATFIYPGSAVVFTVLPRLFWSVQELALGKYAGGEPM